MKTYLKNYHLLILLSLLLPYLSYTQPNLDSLKKAWNDQSIPDSSRIHAIHDLAKFGYLYSQPDSAHYFAQLMYDLAFENNYKEDMASALVIQAGSFYVRGDFHQALKYYEQSLVIFREISDKKGMAKVMNNMGVMYSNLGEFVKAMDFHKRSLAIKEEIPDKNGMAGSMNNIGLIYMNQGDYPKALNNFQKSLKIMEDFGDKRGIAQVLNNIGLIYMRRGDSLEALEHFQRSLAICEDISDKRGSAGILSNIGLIYQEQGKYSIALDYFQRSLTINEEIADRKGVASSFNNIGEIYIEKGEYARAMEYYMESLKIYEDISEKQGMAGTLINIGRAYNKQGNHRQALRWCKQGLETAEEISIIDEQRDACDCLYDAYKAMNNHDKALEYHERSTDLNKRLQEDETAKMLQQMEFARQSLADSLIREEEKLKIQIAHEATVRKKNRTRNIFIFSAILLLLGAFALYRRIVFVRRAKQAIEKEKERSDKLLLNILPSDIADELKEKGRANARKFERVPILFTDFKGFTRISEKLSAEKLVEEINTCFEPFDTICEKYGIEKIKTIGDSYMAAGGLPVPMDDSVRNTVLAGIEMTEFVLQRQKDQKAKGDICFEMRVGIHTGPVIAGIVGIKKFQYDIWGDTVNIASRLENAGVEGKVNISKSTYEFIKDDPAFKFQPRGMVPTKGKGEMEMWFVERS
jgi:class 3 adenylate cyclase/Tfp pilus assembly protein PilF